MLVASRTMSRASHVMTRSSPSTSPSGPTQLGISGVRRASVERSTNEIPVSPKVP